jgi:hypothetical protein
MPLIWARKKKRGEAGVVRPGDLGSDSTLPREVQGGDGQAGVKRTVTRHVGDSSARRTIRAVAALAMHRCQAAPAEA